MRRALAAAIAILLLPAAPAWAADDAERVAAKLDDDPVYVHPRGTPKLSARDRGRIRLRIVRRDVGRIKVAIVPERMVAQAGGIAPLAHAIDSHLELRGALVVRSGGAHFVVTSHPQAEATVAAVRGALAATAGRTPTAQLLAVVDAVARVDPGASADLRQSQAPGGGGVVVPPGGLDDPTDEIVGGFKLALLIVAAAIALPFVVGTAWILLRIRRRRAEESDQVEEERGYAEEELVALGEEIEALDIDTSMPDADRAALAEYEAALAAYDRASRGLQRGGSLRRVRSARATIEEGRSRAAAAKQRLEAAAAEAGGAPAAEPER